MVGNSNNETNFSHKSIFLKFLQMIHHLIKLLKTQLSKMVQFEWFGHYSLISTIVNPSKKKKDLIANSLVNLLSESIKNLLVKKKTRKWNSC